MAEIPDTAVPETRGGFASSEVPGGTPPDGSSTGEPSDPMPCTLPDHCATPQDASWPSPASSHGNPLAAEYAGRYKLLGELGHGGMGSVLRASDPDLNRELAVKILQERHSCDAAAQRRF